MYNNKPQIELLSNFDIIELSKNWGIKLNDIVNKDQLTMSPKQGCYVINLQDSGGSGTHWVCLILDEYISYYDPFGLPHSEDVSRFISWYLEEKGGVKMSPIYSSQQNQGIDSLLCGWYCLWFMYFHTVLHSDNKDNKYLMSKHNKLFNSVVGIRMNDRILQQLIKNLVM
jgi:hypothetical protein